MRPEYFRPVLNPAIFLPQMLPAVVAAPDFPVVPHSLPALDSCLPVLCFSDLDPFSLVPSLVPDPVPYFPVPCYSGPVPVDLLAALADILEIHNFILLLYQWDPILMPCDKRLVLLPFFDFDKMYFPDYTLL